MIETFLYVQRNFIDLTTLNFVNVFNQFNFYTRPYLFTAYCLLYAYALFHSFLFVLFNLFAKAMFLSINLQIDCVSMIFI